MGQMLEDLQYRLKTSSSSLALIFFKMISGVALGLTVALIGQEIIDYGNFAFIFVIVATTGAFFRVAKKWQFIGVAVFDLICVLIGLLLRMYILVAPGG
ncbi:MAG: hypothetical protein AB7N80_06340 [Bdellovibrionales bacterium]